MVLSILKALLPSSSKKISRAGCNKNQKPTKPLMIYRFTVNDFTNPKRDDEGRKEKVITSYQFSKLKFFLYTL